MNTPQISGFAKPFDYEEKISQVIKELIAFKKLKEAYRVRYEEYDKSYLGFPPDNIQQKLRKAVDKAYETITLDLVSLEDFIANHTRKEDQFLYRDINRALKSSDSALMEQIILHFKNILKRLTDKKQQSEPSS